jgi:HEAT repeat protein
MERVRLACVDGLSELDPRPAQAGLLGLLAEDAVWEVRARAAHALGLTGDPAVVPALEAALADQNEYVRSAAATALRLNAEIARRRPPAPAVPAP